MTLSLNKLSVKTVAMTSVTLIFSSATTLALANTTKIGMITTLSGGGSSLGKSVRDGFQLSLKMPDNKDVELLIKDDDSKPAKVAKIVSKF